MSEMLAQALFYGLLLVLPLAALLARRVPTATIARYAVAWIVIFGVALLAVILIL